MIVNMWGALLMVSMLVLGQAAAGPSTAPAGPRAGAGGERTARAAGEFSCTFRALEANVTLDEQNNRMSAQVRIGLETGRDGPSIVFRLRPGMTVRSVTEEGGGPLQYFRAFWYFINVSLGRELPAGTALNITVRYDGEVLNSPDGGQSFWDRVGPEGSWVRTYGGYFPADENWSRTKSRLSVTAPQDKTVVSSGWLAGRTEDAASGTATTVWVNDRPSNGVSFLAGRLDLTGFDLGGHRYDLYLTPGHAASAASYAAEMARITAFYTARFGAPGFGNLTVAEVPSTYSAWGQSLPSMMWLSSRNFDGPLPYRILSHELAHQWWGIDVEGEGSDENFMPQGLAGYSEAMYEMAVYGNRGYLDFCRQQYISRFVQAPGPEPMLVSNDYDLSSYKGPWVMHMARFLVGEANFTAALAALHRERSGGRADHFDLQGALLAASGVDLSLFFHMWLYTSGRLDYAIADALVLRGPGGADRLRLVVERRGFLGDMPMDVGLYFEGGRYGLFGRAWNGSGENVTLAFDVNYPVDAVKLDPENWLLDAYPSSNEAPTRDGFFDVRAGALSVSPAGPLENESFNVSFEVALETSEGAQEVEVALLVDGLPAGNASVRLPPSGSAPACFTLALGPGNHSLAAVADPRDLLFERDEQDNRATGRVTVRPRPPPMPDLGIGPGGVSLRPANAAGGRPAQIAVSVVNTGEAAVAGAAVDVWVDDPGTGYVGRSAGLSVAPSGSGTALVPWTAVPGWHQLTARVVMPPGVEDRDQSDNEATTQVYVNSPPVAVLSVSARQVLPGEWVDLSGALSVDDGRVVRYLFDFGDGEQTGWLSDNGTFHSYAGKGVYQARLLVLDDEEIQSDWSAPVVVRVASLPPVAAIRAPRRTADVLTPLTFGSASSDPDGNISAFCWSFGDGSTASGPLVNHTFTRKGDFTVTLSVQDEDGQVAAARVRVRVVDLPPVPVISFEGRPARVGERVSFSAALTADPDDPPSSLSYIWDFGGGQKASGPEGSFAFTGPGLHRVSLSASDGNLSATTWVEVQVVGAVAPGPPAGGAHPASWAALGALLLSMAALVAFIIFPTGRRKGEEEE